MTASERLSRQVIEACLRRGVAEFVLCPGSRNSPLILAAIGSGTPVWPFVDERAAGFFALGRSLDLERPVAVLTTSGTAVAELYPAMVEALYQRVALLAITADRPEPFRGSGAPQSIEQHGLFCLYAVAGWDVSAAPVNLSGWDGDGPAHLNVCLGEPLLEEAGVPVLAAPTPAALGREPDEPRPFQVPRPDLIVLGPVRERDRERVKRRLLKWRCPVLAEATSGLREDEDLRPWLVRGGERACRGRPLRHVLRVGGVPSFRLWRDLETRPEVTVWNALCLGFRGLGRDSYVLPDFDGLTIAGEEDSALPGEPAGTPDREEEKLEEALAAHPVSEPALVRQLSEQIPRHSRIFLGNSLPIREWNLAASRMNRGHCSWANRGANGIDGNISTYLGWTATHAESWGIFGDLTALYDANAPWILPHLADAKRRIVVLNNGGGKIFARLPHLAGVPGPVKLFTESRHSIRFRAWAELWGLEHVVWAGGTLPDLGNSAVIEVLPDEAETEAFWRDLDRT